MTVEKSVGIMVYFDNFHRAEALPDEQLGLLFRALMGGGEAELEGRDGIAGFEERYPGMTDRTQMAFLFMADNIRRDAAVYNAKCANIRAAAQRREDRKRAARGLEPAERPRPPEPSAGKAEDGGPIVPAPPAVRRRLEDLMRSIRMDD